MTINELIAMGIFTKNNGTGITNGELNSCFYLNLFLVGFGGEVVLKPATSAVNAPRV